jgi:hypothetical protein
MDMLKVDPRASTTMDRRLLLRSSRSSTAGRSGVDSAGRGVGEERGTIEDVIEPYLIQQGYMMRTARGRMATRTAWLHFGLLRSLGFEQDAIAREHGIGFVVRSAALEFVRPARFNDELWSTVRVERCGRASVDLTQNVLHADGTLLCAGRVRVGSHRAEAHGRTGDARTDLPGDTECILICRLRV